MRILKNAMKAAILMMIAGCLPALGTLELEIETATTIPEAIEITIIPDIDPTVTPVPVITPTANAVQSFSDFDFRDISPLAGLVYGSSATNIMGSIQADGGTKPLFENWNLNLKIAMDGTMVLFSDDDDIWIYDVALDEKRNLTNTSEREEGNAIFWPANPDQVVFGSLEMTEGVHFGYGALTMINLDGSGYRLIDEAGSRGNPALSPDGRTIAYGNGRYAWLYDVETEQRRQLTLAEYNLPDVNHAGSFTWSPNGKQLAGWFVQILPDESGSILSLVIIDPLQKGTSQILHQYQPVGGGGWLENPQWSPDGRWIAAVTMSENHRVDLWVFDTENDFKQDFGFASNPRWRPDGERMAFTAWTLGESTADVKWVSTENWAPAIIDSLPEASYLMDWIWP